MSREELSEKLKYEFTDARVNKSFQTCCQDHPDISPEIERIVLAIEDLANSVSASLVKDAKGMERGLKDKCEEIKR